MKKKTIKRLIIIALPIILAIAGYKYIYQDHRDIDTEKPEFVLTSEDLINQFSQDAPASEMKYLNKTIQISGTVTEINANNLVIDNNIFCQFQHQIPTSITVNTTTNIKGRCIGFDDLLEEIKLDQCGISNN